MSELKIKVAKEALRFVEDNTVIGVGTGSTVNCFIRELAHHRHRIDACVASSKATELLLREANIPVIDLNAASDVPLYIDGADEITAQGEMIKGGGGALTREKILAKASTQFLCIADDSKLVARLGAFPIAVEVIPMARSYVARQLVALGGDPEYRENFLTDNGNIILDVYNLPTEALVDLENNINQITGVVENGVFARRIADKILVASAHAVQCLK